MNKIEIKTKIEHWLDTAVIGLGLCPFAKQPRLSDKIEIHISEAKSIESLIMDLVEQTIFLEKATAKETETTLFVIPELLSNFDDYLDCLYLAEEVMQQQGWEGVFQLASFHPEYQFEGTQTNDIENLTNRSPLPIFHILREHSITLAASQYGNTEEIPRKNKETLQALSAEEINSIFD